MSWKQLSSQQAEIHLFVVSRQVWQRNPLHSHLCITSKSVIFKQTINTNPKSKQMIVPCWDFFVCSGRFKRLLILCDIKVIKQSHIALPEKIALQMTYCSDFQVPIVKELKSNNFPTQNSQLMQILLHRADVIEALILFPWNIKRILELTPVNSTSNLEGSFTLPIPILQKNPYLKTSLCPWQIQKYISKAIWAADEKKVEPCQIHSIITALGLCCFERCQVYEKSCKPISQKQTEWGSTFPVPVWACRRWVSFPTQNKTCPTTVLPFVFTETVPGDCQS